MIRFILSFFAYLAGAHYIGRAKICGAITLKNVTTAQLGIEVAETGISVKKLTVRYFPEFKEPFKNHLNQTTGFGVPDKLSREVDLDGAVTGATGRMAATHVAASTLAGDVSDFGDGSGGLYMDESTVEQTSDGWRSLSQKLSSHPECA